MAVHGDGSGEIRAEVDLDKAALAAVPDLGSQLQVADLRSAGWTVTGPSPRSSGGAAVVASKPFGTAREAAADVAELAGPAGPVRDVVVARHPGLLGVSTRVSVTGDLSARLEAFADDALRARMGGHAFGVDEPALQAQAGQPVDQLLSFRVSVTAPGGRTASAAVPLGASRSISTSSRILHVRLILEAGVAVAALGAAMVLTWLRRRADLARWTIGGGRGRRDRWSVRG